MEVPLPPLDDAQRHSMKVMNKATLSQTLRCDVCDPFDMKSAFVSPGTPKLQKHYCGPD